MTGLAVPAIVLKQKLVVHKDLDGTALVGADNVRTRAREPIAAGETLVEWHEGACLTAAEAYSDMDVGRHMRDLAPRVGPGFETVAIATLLAAESVRGFKTRPTSIMPEGGDQAAFENLVPSQWSLLTKALWADARSGEGVDPELAPLVEQAVNLMMPALEHTTRAAWSCGLTGRSKGELLQLGSAAVQTVMRHQKYPLSSDGHWGWREGAPEGPALLPLLDRLAAKEGDGPENAELACLSRPKEGDRGSGVCLRCIASRDIAVGEAVVVGE